MVFVVIVRMRVRYLVVRVLVAVSCTFCRRVLMSVIMMTVVVRVLVRVSDFIVSVTVRMIAHGNSYVVGLQREATTSSPPSAALPDPSALRSILQAVDCRTWQSAL